MTTSSMPSMLATGPPSGPLPLEMASTLRPQRRVGWSTSALMMASCMPSMLATGPPSGPLPLGTGSLPRPQWGAMWSTSAPGTPNYTPSLRRPRWLTNLMSFNESRFYEDISIMRRDIDWYYLISHSDIDIIRARAAIIVDHFTIGSCFSKWKL